MDLSCLATTVAGSNAMGKRFFVRHPYTRSLPIEVRGDRVVVAEVTCAPKKKARDAATHP